MFRTEVKRAASAVAISIVMLAGTAAPAHAADFTTARHQARLADVAKYASAIDVIHVEDRHFTIQADPQTEVEKVAKRYWIMAKIAELQKQILLATW